MDDNSEILRRLVLLDRKLNYLSGLVIGVYALAMAATVFFVVSSEWGYFLAWIAGVITFVILGKAVERLFRRADPN